MTRPRIPLGLDSSRATLNREVCALLGRQLAAARAERTLSVQDVSRRLLLSPAQVMALETVCPEAFYSAEFYVSALRKYVAFLALDPGSADRALMTPAPPQPAMPAPFQRGRPGVKLPTRITRSRPETRLIVATALVVTVIGGLLVVSSVISESPRAPGRSPAPRPVTGPRVNPPSPAPRASSPRVASRRTPAPPTPSVPPAPALAPATLPSGAAPSRPAPIAATAPTEIAGRVRVAKRTWVFVRHADNSTIERGLDPGEEFLLRARPIYLAVGVAAGADVEISGHPIDTTRFTTNGQLRVGASQLAALGSDLR